MLATEPMGAKYSSNMVSVTLGRVLGCDSARYKLCLLLLPLVKVTNIDCSGGRHFFLVKVEKVKSKKSFFQKGKNLKKNIYLTARHQGQFCASAFFFCSHTVLSQKKTVLCISPRFDHKKGYVVEREEIRLWNSNRKALEIHLLSISTKIKTKTSIMLHRVKIKKKITC